MKSPPGTYQASDTPRCNAGKGAVGVDAVMASALGLGGLAVAGDSGEGSLLLFVPAALYGLSAMAGNSSANDCRKAIEAHEAYLARVDQRIDDEVAQDIAEDHAAVAAEAARRGGEATGTADPYAVAGAKETRGDGDGGGGGDGDGDGDGDGGGDGDGDRGGDGDDDAPPRVAPRGDGTWADFWIEVSP